MEVLRTGLLLPARLAKRQAPKDALGLLKREPALMRGKQPCGSHIALCQCWQTSLGAPSCLHQDPVKVSTLHSCHLQPQCLLPVTKLYSTVPSQEGFLRSWMTSQHTLKAFRGTASASGSAVHDVAEVCPITDPGRQPLSDNAKISLCDRQAW